MKINIISILASFASAAIFAGCAKTAAPEYSWITDPNAVRIDASVGALTKTNPFDNTEKQKQFNGPDANGKFLGDEIAVSMVDNYGKVEKTVTYRFDAEVWNPVPVTDYLVWRAPITYKAWYPASAKDGFILPTNQSESLEENYGNSAKADFMTGEYVCDSKDKIPSDHKLKLVMQRKMSLVTVNVDKSRLNSQFKGKTIYMINVESIQSGHSSVSSDGTGSGNPVEVKPGPTNVAYDNNKGKGEYHAIVVPCDGDASAEFLKVTVSWRDEAHPMGESIPFIVTGRPKFEAGKHYTYNLTIGKDKLEVGDVTVNDWGGNVDLNDGGEYDADKTSDPINMTDLRAQLAAWNESNPNNQKQLKDLITVELLNENCKNGKLIISGEFDNTTPAYEDTKNKKCYGMSVETLEAFEKITEFVRNRSNKIKEVDLSGVKGLTGIGQFQKENGSEPYNLSFVNADLVTFTGSSDIVAFGSVGGCFWGNSNLAAVSGLENVTYANGAFQNCRSLTEIPDMPKAASLRHTFSGTSIKELRHDNVEDLAIGDCSALEIIDCPKVNWLIGGAFNGSSSALNSLKELHLTSEFFELVNADVFNGGIPIGRVTLYLNANQESNITHDESNGYYTWIPKKSDGSTAVQAIGTTDYVLLNDFTAIYCGEKKIK